MVFDLVLNVVMFGFFLFEFVFKIISKEKINDFEYVLLVSFFFFKLKENYWFFFVGFIIFV